MSLLEAALSIIIAFVIVIIAISLLHNHPGLIAIIVILDIIFAVYVVKKTKWF